MSDVARAAHTERTTRLAVHLRAPRAAVWRALLDADAVRRWKVPEGMRAEVHEWEPVVGGAIRVSLTYDAPDATGKTSAHTDTYHGRFAELVPFERVVEIDEFETADPSMQGAMTIIITLADADGGTDLVAVHEGVPPGVSLADNETGWQMSLARLADLLESDAR